MEFRLFILSLACLCCLTPPAFGSIHALKAAAVVGAAKGAALLGAGALAIKGAAIKGAAIKGAAIKGAALKGAALKGVGAVIGAAVKGAAILAAKGAAVKGGLALAANAANIAGHRLAEVLPPPIVVQSAANSLAESTVVGANSVAIDTNSSLPPAPNSFSSWGSAQSEVQQKIEAVGSTNEFLHPRPVIIAPIIYEKPVPMPSRFFPLLQRVEVGCL